MGNSESTTKGGADEILLQSLEGIGRRLQTVEMAVRALRAELDHTLTLLRTQAFGLQQTASASTRAPDQPPSQFPSEPLFTSDDVSGHALASRGSDASDGGLAREGTNPESARKEEARRYARVLVSEIELYHGAEVAQGRESKDLYTRLKTHIDRGRKAFHRRFGKPAPGEASLFDDQLVQTLAKNDITLLGPGYSPEVDPQT